MRVLCGHDRSRTEQCVRRRHAVSNKQRVLLWYMIRYYRKQGQKITREDKNHVL